MFISNISNFSNKIKFEAELFSVYLRFRPCYRFGKTISVSMFAAAMLYSTPSLELSIYSTCKRISQKLMRNVTKFIGLIYEATHTTPLPVIRSNMEEVVLQGPDGCQDIRVVNSYPSKVCACPCQCSRLRVLLLQSLRILLAAWYLSIRYASVSVCSALSASPSHRRSGFKLSVISRTSL